VGLGGCAPARGVPAAPLPPASRRI
jgi:hypothetical protein